MGLFSWLKKDDSNKKDVVDFNSMYDDVEKLGIRNYEQSHFDTCKKIWHEYVPERGQAKCVQGELLRQLEALRYEAQDNGNINWDDNLYNYIEDAIAVYAEANPEPIEYAGNEAIYR